MRNSTIRTSGLGRQRQFVAIGCSRSAPNWSLSSVGMCERPLSSPPTLSATWANVKFQGGPDVRWENRRRLLWVDSASSSLRAAVVRPAPDVKRRWPRRTTATEVSSPHLDVDRCQLSRYSGRPSRKPPPAPMGRYAKLSIATQRRHQPLQTKGPEAAVRSTAPIRR